MQTQLLVLFALIVLIVGAFQNRGTGGLSTPALAMAFLAHDAQSLYERSALWFDKSLEDVEKSLKEGIDGMKTTVKGWVEEAKEATNKKASQEDIDKLKEEYKSKFEQMQEGFDKLQAEASRLQDAAKGEDKQTIMQMVEKKITSEFLTKAKKAAHGSEDKGFNLDLKAASIVTTGYALTGSNATLLRAFEMEPGVAKDPTAPFFIQDLISVGATASHTVFWNERVQVEGGAGQVAENTRFPQLSVQWAKKSANSKKTAVYTKITEEMQEDVDFVLSEIQDEIVDGPGGMRNAVENQILTGDGTGENHLGIFTQAAAFDLPTGMETLENPTNFDLIEAMVLQITLANYVPTHVIFGAAAWTNMRLTKDANQNYIIPPFVTANGMEISGLVAVRSNRVPANTVLVGNPSLFKLRVNRALQIRFYEQNEDDALTDRQTITGSLRAASFIKTPDLKGFVKSTFTAGKNLIKTV